MFKLVSINEYEYVYFNPSTGKLGVHKAEPVISIRMASFAPAYYSVVEAANDQGHTSREFFKAVER